MAGKGGKRSTSWKPGQSGNPKGAPGFRSLSWHIKQRFNDEDKARSIDAQIIRARAGDERSLRLLAELGGEVSTADATPNRTNILAILAGTDRGLLERLFTALPLGGGDAGGMGGLRIEERGDVETGVDALEASDADQ